VASVALWDDSLDDIVRNTLEQINDSAQLALALRKLSGMAKSPRSEFELVRFLKVAFPSARLHVCSEIASCVNLETMDITNEALVTRSIGFLRTGESLF
jgi:hypothetical protein